MRVSYADSDGAFLLADSEGRLAFDRQPMARLAVGCTAEQNGRRETNHHNFAGRAGFEFFTARRMEEAADEAVRRTLFLFDATVGPAGEMPVVLAAGSSGIPPMPPNGCAGLRPAPPLKNCSKKSLNPVPSNPPGVPPIPPGRPALPHPGGGLCGPPRSQSTPNSS